MNGLRDIALLIFLGCPVFAQSHELALKGGYRSRRASFRVFVSYLAGEQVALRGHGGCPASSCSSLPAGLICATAEKVEIHTPEGSQSYASQEPFHRSFQRRNSEVHQCAKLFMVDG